MPDWRVKAVVQRGLHRLPAGSAMNYFLQRYVTRTAVLRPTFARAKIEQCGRHWRNWVHAHPGVVPDRVVELGTGWFPFVTIGLSLMGCREVVTVDRTPLLRAANIAATLRVVAQGVADGWVLEHLGAVAPDRLAILQRLAAHQTVTVTGLAELGIRLVVGDAADLPFEARSVDLFVSNNTLEHIPEPALRAIFAEYRRTARGTACMSHFIDMSDHYSHFDSSISPINFLRFDDRSWRRWDNGIVPQNRLRLSQYRGIHEATGWMIVDEDVRITDERSVDVVPLADGFRQFDHTDLSVTHAWVVAKPDGEACLT